MIFKILTLVAMAGLYGCYMAKKRAQKRQGIRTDQLGLGKTGFVKAIELSLKAFTYLVGAAELISVLLATTKLPTAARAAGQVCSLLGAGVFILSVREMKDSWRAGVPENEKTELVTTGIYAWSRNPAFLGFDLLFLGVALTWFNLPLALLSLAAVTVFHLQIVNVEEDYLIVTFGENYLDYRRRVRRYLGRRAAK